MSKSHHLLRISLLDWNIYGYYCLSYLNEAADLKDLSKLTLRMTDPNVLQYYLFC